MLFMMPFSSFECMLWAVSVHTVLFLCVKELRITCSPWTMLAVDWQAGNQAALQVQPSCTAGLSSSLSSCLLRVVMTGLGRNVCCSPVPLASQVVYIKSADDGAGQRLQHQGPLMHNVRRASLDGQDWPPMFVAGTCTNHIMNWLLYRRCLLALKAMRRTPQQDCCKELSAMSA